MRDARTLTALAGWYDAGSPKRALIDALAANVTPETIAKALALVRGDHDFHDFAAAIGWEFPDELFAAVLPGAQLADDVDLRCAMSLKARPDWQGDLLVRPVEPQGVDVVIGSLRGANALAAMSREVRAAITSCGVAPRRHEDRIAIHRVISELHFDGITSLRLDDDLTPAIATSTILHCPAIEDYSGTVVGDIAEALTTTAVRTIYASKTDADSLRRLAGARWLRELWLSALDRGVRLHLAALADYGALAVLHASSGELRDEDAAAIARVATLEELHLHSNPFGDRGGVALARLAQLRKLDLHETQIGDATLAALVELPHLEELDLADTRITLAGFEAIGRARNLKRIGLSWTVDDAFSEVAKRHGIAVSWNDYVAGGGALWGSGYTGP